MPKIYNCVDELIGKTPLMRLNKFEKKYNLNARILAKLEFFNPAGSVKDRVALNMLNEAEEQGRLLPGGTVIEPTSGNTGIGLAALAAARGYKAAIVMPDTMSVERQKLIKAYGAQVILTPGAKGMAGAIEKAEEIKENTPNSIIAGQFVNPANPQAHMKTTAVEIWQDTDGEVDIFVASVGTGGTLTGNAEYLKQKNPNVKIVAVEPSASPLLSKGVSGAHKIQGIGANFVPEILNTEIYDEIIAVPDEAAFDYTKAVAKSEGILVGISSGAVLYAAAQLARRSENEGKNIVVILPDTGERYLSTPGFAD